VSALATRLPDAVVPVSTLPVRKYEAWRYSDLTALGGVWSEAPAGDRVISVPAGETLVVDERLEASGWHNEAVAVTVGDGAHLILSVVQARALDAVTTQVFTVTIGDGAHCRFNILQHGSRFGRIALEVTLGANAVFELGGVILGRGEQTSEIVTTVTHAAPGAVSRQVVRTVVDERATGSYLGKVAVARAGQQTDAAQSLKALLLARTATANAKPELEIFADDVKCAHGATVGELDAQALFYLASRGVGPAEAKTLLIEAFIGDAELGEALTAEAVAWLRGEV